MWDFSWVHIYIEVLASGLDIKARILDYFVDVVLEGVWLSVFVVRFNDLGALQGG